MISKRINLLLITQILKTSTEFCKMCGEEVLDKEEKRRERIKMNAYNMEQLQRMLMLIKKDIADAKAMKR